MEKDTASIRNKFLRNICNFLIIFDIFCSFLYILAQNSTTKYFYYGK